MDWRDARSELELILGTVAITTPIVASILRVHPTPPKTIGGELPCIVIRDVAKTEERACAMRDRTYTVNLRLLVKDADLHQAADIIDAFEEAISAELDNNVALNGLATGIQGPTWEPPALLSEAGQEFNGAEGELIVRLLDSVVYAG